MKRIISVAAALTAIAVTTAACAGSANPPNATTSTTAPISSAAKAREAAKYLKLVAPYDAERAKIAASNISPTTTAALQASLAPLVAASNTFASGIQHAGFTGQEATPALTMAIAVESVVADIQAATKGNWTAQKSVIAQAQATVTSEGNRLRSALGLPAATG